VDEHGAALDGRFRPGGRGIRGTARFDHRYGDLNAHRGQDLGGVWCSIVGSLKVWSFAIAEARQGEEFAGGQVPRRRSLAVQGCCGLRRAGVRVALLENGRQGCARRDAGSVLAVAAGDQERRRGEPAPGGGACAGSSEGGRHGASCPCAWPPVPIAAADSSAAAAAGKEGSALLVDGAASPVRRRLESTRWPPR